MNYILSEHFLKTKVRLSNLGTPNVILDLFIRTGAQKCQPFLTHCTHISPKKDTNSGKITLINKNVYFTILCPFFMSDGRNGRVNLPHDQALQYIALFGHISNQNCINYINVQCLLLQSPKIYFQ